MCGILCEIQYSGSGCSKLKETEVLQRIKNRGPDCYYAVQIQVSDDIMILFCGAVLWMQGFTVSTQPLDREEGILLYNGDIFDDTWDHLTSDTEKIMYKLCSVKIPADDQIIKVFKQLKGPFSIIYYSKANHNLYFTRDRIGRNTLLFHKCENSIILSSILGRRFKCVEVPATHIIKLNVKTKQLNLYPWCEESLTVTNVDDWFVGVEKLQSLPDDKFQYDTGTAVNLNDDHGVINFIENIAKERSKQTLMKNLLEHHFIKDTVLNLTELLKKSIRMRLEAQPQKCKECLNKSVACNHSSVGILFSGGLDCTILAFLADKYLSKDQAIDLINVAFSKDNISSYEVPDRLTGKQSFNELRKLCPWRKWIFREVNVPKQELEQFQRSTIADLIHPRQTILDESLGSALWFAARGFNGNSASHCRVLLLGSGADELFGGYTRHRNAFKRHGWHGLNKELELDWRRISFRNLARDNRVICDHGRQPRMPYLDEDFTDFVLKLKPWLKCFPSDGLVPGVGDKLMLRLVAFHLGLEDVVLFPKRALQFGSRIANKKEKGSDISKTFED